MILGILAALAALPVVYAIFICNQPCPAPERLAIGMLRDFNTAFEPFRGIVKMLLL